MLKITGGERKGRRIITPEGGEGSRPSPARVREAIFSILGERVEGAKVLDLFAGPGTYGLEALSRGASSALFVESSRRVAQVIGKNLLKLDLKDRGEVFVMDAVGFIVRFRGKGPFSLIFADPPYGKGYPEEVLRRAAANAMLERGGALILEHESKLTLPDRAGELLKIRERSFGQTVVTVYFRGRPMENLERIEG